MLLTAIIANKEAVIGNCQRLNWVLSNLLISFSYIILLVVEMPKKEVSYSISNLKYMYNIYK